MKITTYKLKPFYYTCEICSRQISSFEYYAYGRCDICRFTGGSYGNRK